MDVYQPHHPNQRWMLVIHGGGFTTGSRNMKPSRTIAAYFLARGWQVYSADYPLARAGGIKLPEQRESVENAVRAAARHAQRQTGVASKGVLLGCSAGATLALLASEQELDHVETVVSCFGLYDFTALDAPLLKLFRGLVLGSASHEAALVASPSHRAKPLPRTVLLHGTADRLVPHEQAEQMERALVRAGAKAERFEYVGAPHAFFNDRRSPTCLRALADIDRALSV
jgi:acetyl esterase/lipase